MQQDDYEAALRGDDDNTNNTNNDDGDHNNSNLIDSATTTTTTKTTATAAATKQAIPAQLSALYHRLHRVRYDESQCVEVVLYTTATGQEWYQIDPTTLQFIKDAPLISQFQPLMTILPYTVIKFCGTLNNFFNKQYNKLSHQVLLCGTYLSLPPPQPQVPQQQQQQQHNEDTALLSRNDAAVVNGGGDNDGDDDQNHHKKAYQIMLKHFVAAKAHYLNHRATLNPTHNALTDEHYLPTTRTTQDEKTKPATRRRMIVPRR